MYSSLLYPQENPNLLSLKWMTIHSKFLRKSRNFNEKAHFSKLTLIRLHQGMLSFHIIVCVPFCTGYGDEYCENNGKSLFERHLSYWFYRICDRFCTQINFFCNLQTSFLSRTFLTNHQQSKVESRSSSR